MIINSSISSRTVEDYDLTFPSGFVLPITLDRDAGDTVDFDSSPTVVMFHLAEKPSNTDSAKIPAEDITVYVVPGLVIQHRTRTIQPLTPEQRDEFKRTLIATATSIN